MKKRSNMELLEHLLARLKLESTNFDGIEGLTNMPQKASELDAFIKARIRPYFTTWVIPLAEELLKREYSKRLKRMKREGK